MFTHELRKRICKIIEGGALSFPNNFTIEYEFKPLQPFGSGLDKGVTTTKNEEAKTFFNDSTGKHHIEPNNLFDPVDVTITTPNLKYVFEGNKFIISGTIESLTELENLIEEYFYYFPIFLNIEFVDTPHIEYVNGTVGDTKFHWGLEKWSMESEVTTQDRQEQKIEDTWNRYLTVADNQNMRLIAALYYFHHACRLKRAGVTQWEFMSEVILNYTKMLEVLFPAKGESQSMTKVREECKKLGFDDKQIEKYFVSPIALRNKVDVAHVDMSVFKQEQLDALQKFTETSEKNYRELLRVVFSKLRDKSYSIPDYNAGDLEPRKEASETMQALVKNFADQ